MSVQLLSQAWDLIQKGGYPLALIIILYANYKGWWYWGWQHQKELDKSQNETKECNAELALWRRLALKGTQLAELFAGTQKESEG